MYKSRLNFFCIIILFCSFTITHVLFSLCSFPFPFFLLFSSPRVLCRSFIHTLFSFLSLFLSCIQSACALHKRRFLFSSNPHWYLSLSLYLSLFHEKSLCFLDINISIFVCLWISFLYICSRGHYTIVVHLFCLKGTPFIVCCGEYRFTLLNNFCGLVWYQPWCEYISSIICICNFRLLESFTSAILFLPIQISISFLFLFSFFFLFFFFLVL